MNWILESIPESVHGPLIFFVIIWVLFTPAFYNLGLLRFFEVTRYLTAKSRFLLIGLLPTLFCLSFAFYALETLYGMTPLTENLLLFPGLPGYLISNLMPVMFFAFSKRKASSAKISHATRQGIVAFAAIFFIVALFSLFTAILIGGLFLAAFSLFMNEEKTPRSRRRRSRYKREF